MGKKDRLRAAATGQVHREGEKVDKAEAVKKVCEVPHCNVDQMIPRIKGLPLCHAHTERFLTQLFFDDKIKAAQQPAQTQSGLVVATGSQKEKEALRDIARGFNLNRSRA